MMATPKSSRSHAPPLDALSAPGDANCCGNTPSFSPPERSHTEQMAAHISSADGHACAVNRLTVPRCAECQTLIGSGACCVSTSTTVWQRVPLQTLAFSACLRSSRRQQSLASGSRSSSDIARQLPQRRGFGPLSVRRWVNRSVPRGYRPLHCQSRKVSASVLCRQNWGSSRPARTASRLFARHSRHRRSSSCPLLTVNSSCAATPRWAPDRYPRATRYRRRGSNFPRWCWRPHASSRNAVRVP